MDSKIQFSETPVWIVQPFVNKEGVKYIDIRNFYLPEGQKNLQPSTKGACIKLSAVPNLQKALSEAVKIIEEKEEKHTDGI